MVNNSLKFLKLSDFILLLKLLLLRIKDYNKDNTKLPLMEKAYLIVNLNS